MTKRCIVCGKPLTGRQTKLCSDRKCHRVRNAERGRKDYQKNPEKHRERGRKGYQRNKEETLKRLKEDRQKNPEKYRERGRKGYQRNPEKHRERAHEYYLNNPEKCRESTRKSRQKNPERCREYDRKNYRRIRGFPDDWDLSKESSIETIMKEWLQESDIEFIQQHPINFENMTWTRVDFYIPEANICLYCDGDYWHGPEKPDVQERDIRINKALEGMGHSVVRMTEAEILEGSRPWWIGELLSTKW